MPYTIKTQQIAVKDPDTGEYIGVDLLTEQTAEGLINEIAQEGTAQKNSIISFGDSKKQEIANTGAAQIGAIGVKGQETLASIPSDYTELTKTVESIVRGGIIYDVASGSIASFDNGVDSMLIKSLVANIDPVQDLHGYEHPWIGGSGKNKLPVVRTNTTISGVTFTWTDDGVLHLSGAPSANFRYDLNGGNSFTLPAGTYYLSGKNIPASTGTNWYLALRSYPESSAGNVVVANMNGASVQFTISTATEFYPVAFFNNNNVDTAGGVFEPMIRLASETDDTYEPYENECPISGHAEITISHSRADTSNPESLTIAWPDSAGTLETFLSGDATDTYRGITIEKQYNELIINGVATGDARFKVSNTMAHAVSIQDGWLSESIGISNGLKKVIIEIVSGEVTSGTMYCALYKTNGETTFTNVIDTTTTESRNIITFEKSNNDAACVVVYCPANTSVNNLHLRFTVLDPCIYSGMFDAVSGKLTATKAKLVFDGSDDENWLKYISPKHRFFYLDEPSIVPNSSTNLSYISNKLENAYIVLDTGELGFYFTASNNTLRLRYADDNDLTVDDLRAWLAAEPLEIVAELVEPISYQLTPQEIECFLGVNNIWADTGDVTVTYPVDTKTYIDKKIQEAISGLSGS